MGKSTKLELTWIGKENRLKLEPRIMLEDTQKSYHTPRRVTDDDLFDAQDDIDRRPEQLVAEIEGKLQQLVSQEKLFFLRWIIA